MEKIIQIDKQLMVFLNNLGSPEMDDFWQLITKQFSWTPLFILLAFLLYKAYGWKKLVIILLTVAVMLTIVDQSTNLIKEFFKRIRPCNDDEIKHLIRVVKQSDSYGYFSGHASNSMANMMFVFLLLRKHFKFAYLLFLFPLIFGFSRIYLGMHFPFDILSGYVYGAIWGFLFYRVVKRIKV